MPFQLLKAATIVLQVVIAVMMIFKNFTIWPEYNFVVDFNSEAIIHSVTMHNQIE
jgi:hypothetical protein